MKKNTHSGAKRILALVLTVLMVITSVPALSLVAFAEGISAMLEGELPRYELNFNKGWKFNLGDVSGAQSNAYSDSAWKSVNLPHDFSIIQNFTTSGTEGESGNLPGGTGWYRKSFVMPADYAGKSVIINFGASYCETQVYVNGTLMGENLYGYNPFSFDISDYLKFDGTKNIIAVKVKNPIPNSRFYSGSGLIGDVTMTIVNPVHVSLYGTQITTPNLASSNGTNGTTNIAVTLQNDGTTAVSGYTITATATKGDTTVGTATQTASLSVGATQTVTLSMSVNNPQLWSTTTPNLYNMHVEIKNGDVVIDEYDTTYGYTWSTWDGETGFRLNGQALKLQGVCMHLDQGALGTAAEYDAFYRQVKILKDMGVNAIRTSHNIFPTSYYDVCNELGMLVMEEFFDGWTTNKNSNYNAFGNYFNNSISSSNKNIDALGKKWYQYIITQTVKRDRNYPCIFSWDVGNELDDVNATNISSDMKNIIDALDSRPILWGNNKGSAQSIDQHMDIFGGNYNISSYISIGTGSGFGMPFVGTETASAIGSRGEYSWTSSNWSQTGTSYEHNMNYASSSNYQVSAYDSAKVGWGNTAADAWYKTIVYDWNAGEFVWTGFDYIGEPTPWNAYKNAAPATYPNSSYFGIIDTAGFAKDSYYLYNSFWDTSETTLHITPGTWNQEHLAVSNGYVDVAVYTNANYIELLCNGSVIATATATTHTTAAGYTYKTYTENISDSSKCKVGTLDGSDDHDMYPLFEVAYNSSDVITAKAYTAQGGTEITNTVGTKQVKANTASAIQVSAWNNDTTLTADADSFNYVEITAVDAQGNFANDYNGTLNITLTGAGKIAGVDNGNAASTQKFQTPSAIKSDKSAQVQMFNGKALVIVQSTEETGSINVTVAPTDGKTAKSIGMTSVAETGAELTDEFEEVIDQTVTPDQGTDTDDVYEDRYNLLKENIEALETPVQGDHYLSYEVGSSVPEYVPTGTYILVGENGSSSGVLNTTSSSTGKLDTSGTEPTSSSQTFAFTRKDNGKYTIAFTGQNVTNEFLNISANGITIGVAPQDLDVTFSNGTVVIGDGTNCITYSADETNKAGVSVTGTPLKLYTLSAARSANGVTRWGDVGIIEDGTYVIWGQVGTTGYVMTPNPVSNSSGTKTGLEREAAEPVDGVIDTDEANEVTITKVEDSTNDYTIQLSTGKYLKIENTNSKVSVSDDPVNVQIVTSSLANRPKIVSGYTGSYGQCLNIFDDSDAKFFCNWYQKIDTADVNQCFGLYKKTVGATAQEVTLYSALNNALSAKPGNYTDDTYTALLDEIQAGYETYTSETATDTEKQAAATAIVSAYNALEEEEKPTTTISPTLKEDIAALTAPVTGESGYYLYEPQDGVAIPDGEYVIYNVGHSSVITNNIYNDGTNQGFYLTAVTPDGNKIETNSNYEVTITNVGDDVYTLYYASLGKYFSILSTDNKLVTAETDAHEISFYRVPDQNYYVIGYDFASYPEANDTPHLLDCFSSDYVSQWTGKISDAASVGKKQFALYRKVESASASKVALYNAMVAANVDRGFYTTGTYSALQLALQEGYNTYVNSAATDDEADAATAAINAAFAALKVDESSNAYYSDRLDQLQTEINALEEPTNTTYSNVFTKVTPNTAANQPVLEDGRYLISRNLSGTNYRFLYNQSDSTGVDAGNYTVTDTQLTGGLSWTESNYVFDITLVSGTNQYQVRSISNHYYLNVPASGAPQMVSSASTVTIAANSTSGCFSIGNGSGRYIGVNSGERWTGSGDATIAACQLVLLKSGINPDIREVLYKALQACNDVDGDLYTASSLKNLIEAINNGKTMYNESVSTADEYQAAADAIYAAIDNLVPANLKEYVENGVANLTPPSGDEATYERYTANYLSEAGTALIPEGDYIITGHYDTSANTHGAYGVMTNTYVLDDGVFWDGYGWESSHADPDINSDTWYIQNQTNGTYRISRLNGNGVREYLYIANGSSGYYCLLSATTATSGDNYNNSFWNAVIASDGTVQFQSTTRTGYAITFTGSSAHSANYISGDVQPFVSSYLGDGTPLTLYRKVNGKVVPWYAPVADGKYVVTNEGSDASQTVNVTSNLMDIDNPVSQQGFHRTQVTITNDLVTTQIAHELNFAIKDGTTNEYYITNNKGEYLTIEGQSKLKFTATPTTLYVESDSYGNVVISATVSSTVYYLDYYYNNGQVFGSWDNTTVANNNRMRLFAFKQVVSTDNEYKQALYNKLKEAMEINGDIYTEDSYNNLLMSMLDGIETYEDSASQQQNYIDAIADIDTAIDNLVPKDLRSFLLDAINGLTPPKGTPAYYARYTASYVEDNIIPDGSYVIVGDYDSATQSYGASGVMTHTYITAPGNVWSADEELVWTAMGYKASGEAANPQSPTWNIIRDEETGYYRISKLNGNRVEYLYVKEGNHSDDYYLSYTVEGTELYETRALWIADVQSDGRVIFKLASGKQPAIAFTGESAHLDENGYSADVEPFVTSVEGEGTPLELYRIENNRLTKWNVAVSDGTYIVTNHPTDEPQVDNTTTNLMTSSANGTTLTMAQGMTISDADEIYSSVDNQLTFTRILGTNYSFYITNIDGKYLKLTSAGVISFVDEPTASIVSADEYGNVLIKNSNSTLVLEAASNSFTVDTNDSTDISNKMRLFSNVRLGDSSEKIKLLKKLYEAIAIEQGEYTDESYNNLLNAINDGVDSYNNDTTDAEWIAAREAIEAAIDALYIPPTIETFGATLYKYGYTPSNDYSHGGKDYNELMIREMAQQIKNTPALLSQIEAIVDGASGTFSSTTERETAIDAVVNEYAQLYTLRFWGDTVNSGSVNLADGNYATFWNLWEKAGTTASDETRNQGASIQGIFSTTLNENGLPGQHTPYATLPYINGTITTDSQLPSDVAGIDGLHSLKTLSITKGGSSLSVTLPALNNISVYVPDYFSKNDLLSTDLGTSATETYAKHYWNVAFPFVATNNQFGVTKYVYDSTDQSYTFQASYDDDTHTAKAQLTEVSGDTGKVNASGGDVRGFYPFNNRLDGTNSNMTSIEKAVYHYGMSFTTQFSIPESGHYGDDEDIVFDFIGDDDVLVYIDNVLVLDNSGLHGAREASINFTDKSVSYQFVGDVETGTITNPHSEGVTYTYGAENAGISTQNAAAIEYLNKVATDGEMHTFSFYFLERGSSESNCRIEFNIQKISDNVHLFDQSYVFDYGLPIQANVKDNNEVITVDGYTPQYDYIGITSTVPHEAEAGLMFRAPDSQEVAPFDIRGQISYNSKYGTVVADQDGNINYTLNVMNFATSGEIYFCAKITNDPTYEEGTVYYMFEKVTLIPATTIYFEDDFSEGAANGIIYTDGTVPRGESNAENYGVWEIVTNDQDGNVPAITMQNSSSFHYASTDVYGHDEGYEQFAFYSNAGAHKVNVSAKNNPNTKYSGGEGASWPKVEFNFAGTGVDIISLTSKNTGAVNIVITDEDGNVVENNTVNTYYGYQYGQLYRDASGKETLTAEGNTPLYLTTGLDYSTTPSYFNDKNEVVAEDTGNPAYAKGWIMGTGVAEDVDNAMYQVPILKVVNLDYGTYNVTITPMYSSRMDSAKKGNYDFYLDAVRVYNPAGYGDTLTDPTIAYTYTNDKEGNSDYLELRDMIIGTDKLTIGNYAKGAVFVDGISDNTDVSLYKAGGPNNELYLSAGQAVAFEIWATSIPDDLQVGARCADTTDDGFGTPRLEIVYTNGTTTVKGSTSISTATDLNYSVDGLLRTTNPNSPGQLNWTPVVDTNGDPVLGEDGKQYYTSGVVVVKNTGAGILGITSVKWNFAVSGVGFYQNSKALTAAADEPAVVMMSDYNTFARTRMALRMNYADLDVNQDSVEIDNAAPTAGEDVTVKVTTSTDVETLVIRDKDNNVITPEKLESFVETIDDADVKVWEVTLKQNEAGEYTYYITGAYENGYEGGAPAVITVNVTAPEESEAPEEPEEELSFLEQLVGFFNKLIDFFKKLLSMFTSELN